MDTDKLVQWLENVGNVMSEEIPIFVQEVATYGIFSNILEFFVCVGTMVFLFLVFRKICKLIKKSDDETPDLIKFLLVISLVATSVLSIYFFTASFVAVQNVFKATLCPKLYVIDLMKK